LNQTTRSRETHTNTHTHTQRETQRMHHWNHFTKRLQACDINQIYVPKWNVQFNGRWYCRGRPI